ERDIDEGDRPAARDPDPTEAADERVEQQGDEQRHEEEEEHVTHGSGHRQDEQQQDRQQHELRPARDLDAHGPGLGHASDGIGGSARIQGNLALQWLEDPWRFDTLPRDMPSSRPNGRRRVERRSARTARRSRRVALLVLLSAVFVVALALTAFSGGTEQASILIPHRSLATAAQTRPTPEIVA